MDSLGFYSDTHLRSGNRQYGSSGGDVYTPGDLHRDTVSAISRFWAGWKTLCSGNHSDAWQLGDRTFVLLAPGPCPGRSAHENGDERRRGYRDRPAYPEHQRGDAPRRTVEPLTPLDEGKYRSNRLLSSDVPPPRFQRNRYPATGRSPHPCTFTAAHNPPAPPPP